jgi:hypothetical protein
MRMNSSALTDHRVRTAERQLATPAETADRTMVTA